MDQDRRNITIVDLKMKQLEERLVQMEYLSGVCETKPKIFIDIDN